MLAFRLGLLALITFYEAGWLVQCAAVAFQASRRINILASLVFTGFRTAIGQRTPEN